MTYSCKILLDSISETGKRITTMEITFPRIVLAEFNTHRMFSRNSASSRAIPFEKQIERIVSDPFIPEKFPINGKGMQPVSYVEPISNDYDRARDYWLFAKDQAIESAYNLRDAFGSDEIFIHKQIVNRLLEPFMWHTVIVTATEWDNFFKLRTHPDAQYEIKRIADLMYEAYHCHDGGYGDTLSLINPHTGVEWTAPPIQKLKIGEWHCPLVYEEDDELIDKLWRTASGDKYNWIVSVVGEGEIVSKQIRKMISVARCARVSYLTHDGKRDIEKDLELFERLRTSGHWSPFEHVATPYFSTYKDYQLRDFADVHSIFQEKGNKQWFEHQSGNFLGWKQFRKEFTDENCVRFRKE